MLVGPPHPKTVPLCGYLSGQYAQLQAEKDEADKIIKEDHLRVKRMEAERLVGSRQSRLASGSSVLGLAQLLSRRAALWAVHGAESVHVTSTQAPTHSRCVQRPN
jgi:hypothetical protein